MLNYYIMQLVGDKISSLKVENREKYAFKPRNLLQEIIGIWLHLAHEKEFLVKVATDERSERRKRKSGREETHAYDHSLTRVLTRVTSCPLCVTISSVPSGPIVPPSSPRLVASCVTARSCTSVRSSASSVSTSRWSS